MWEIQPSGKKLVFRKIDTRIQNSIQITNNWIGLDWLAGTGVATTHSTFRIFLRYHIHKDHFLGHKCAIFKLCFVDSRLY